MALMPTSITLFLIQIGTFFANIIVAICCGLYVSAYPRSPDAQKLSPIALGTLAFACLSALVTLILIFRQKSGKTMRAIFETTWIFLAIAMWILAFVGGILRPANGMTTVSCKVLPDGTTETSDGNYIRACQAMFASTAFCLVSALLFIVTAVMLFVFSVKSTWRNRKSRNNQVGGHYKLTTTLSQYRRAEKEDEEAKRLKGAGEHEEAAAAETTSTANNSAAATTIDLSDGHFSDKVYQDPYISAMPTALPTAMSSPAPYYSPYGAGAGGHNSSNSSTAHQNSNNNAHLAFLKKEQFKVHTQPREENEREQLQLQQQQQQQYQYQQQQQQQQQSWNQQQPTFGGY
ncbi:hypothetical protein EC991_007670 [Linnemannia zychae]|nr:hypothetical protein EC991_007670 [Linnemannia zychae]